MKIKHTILLHGIKFALTLSIAERESTRSKVDAGTLLLVPERGRPSSIDLNSIPTPLSKLLPHAYATAKAHEWDAFVRKAIVLGLL